jgi:hypothetical protein
MDGEGVKRWCTETLADKILSRSEITVKKKEKERRRDGGGEAKLGDGLPHQSVSLFFSSLRAGSLSSNENVYFVVNFFFRK